MGQAKSRGTQQQRKEEAQQRNQRFNSTDDLQRFLGFNRLQSKDEFPGDVPEDALVCLVSNIVMLNQDALCQQSGLKFQIGDWFVSTGKHENTVIHGPFLTVEVAFEFARINFDAVRFVALDE
ncbi:hypothetical protein ACO0LD_26580 [Undibacterium sp. Ji83W]|uniref:hypothetical protein n=1 Tax=Undibacterium sp. Ji83W TaxID=3413043 RepID=UPI003BF0B40C